MFGSYPTPAEIPVLKALWALGTATNGAVVAHLQRVAGLRYESNQPTQLLRRLVDRGLVVREPAPAGTRGHLYAAAMDKKEMVNLMLEHVMAPGTSAGSVPATAPSAPPERCAICGREMQVQVTGTAQGSAGWRAPQATAGTAPFARGSTK